MFNKKGIIATILLLGFSLANSAENPSEKQNDTLLNKTVSQDNKSICETENSINNNPFYMSKITPLSYLKADSIITKLISKGISIEKNRVIYSGILDSSDSRQYLIVISIDEKNNQVKNSFLLDTLLVDESSQAREEVKKEEQKLTEDKPSNIRQDGRVYFMLNCAVKSIYVYSLGLNLAFPNTAMKEPQIITGLSLLSLGISLYGSYLYTTNMEMGYGRVEFMNYGGDLGVTYSLFLAILLDNIGEFKDADKLHGLGQMILFPAGIFAGSKVKFTDNFEYGNASIMTNMSRFGVIYGFAIPWIFSPPSKDSKKYLIYSTSLSMAFIPTSFYLGKVLVDKYGPFSSGRSVFVTTGGVMGALTGLLLPTLWDEKREEIYPVSTILCNIGGTIFGFNYKKDRSYTFGQGMFMVASSVVGTAVAEAIPFIGKVENHKPYVVFGIIGGWGGLIGGEVLARTLFEKSSRDNSNKTEKYSVNLAGIYQLPLLWAYSKNNNLNKNVEIRIPVMEINF